MDWEGDHLNSPWYKDRARPHPFSLVKKFGHPEKHPFFSVAFFPWALVTLEVLWNGSLNTPQLFPGWKDMINEWTGAIAVGSKGRLYVLSTRNTNRPLCCELPHDSAEIRSVAWALSQESPLEPLVLFSGSSVIYAFNVKKRQVTSALRGHGGLITSLTVHPTHPYLFCTTSRDFTARIYDLTLTPQDKPNNPEWLPETSPSLAGAAHGLHMAEAEGIGLGRCVAVLVGGRSGGHRAAVLSAAFHSVLPLIATCGLDRVVKIWHIPPLSGDTLARLDKPLFSSSLIHKARVLSITWLSFDVLLTHSAPTLMRNDDVDVPGKNAYFEEGTLALWRWLGMDRFFPPGHLIQKVLRGCASDYQESASFKLISVSPLPIIATEHPNVPASPILRIYQSPTHDPLVLLIHFDINTIRMLNVTHFTPRKPKASPPLADDDVTVVEMTKRLRLTETEEEAEEAADGSSTPSVTGWDITVDDLEGGIKKVGAEAQTEKLQACEMGFDGHVIVGVGSRGTVWVWSMPP